MKTQQIIRSMTILAIVLIASFAVNAGAQELNPHNPYTVWGHQLRSELITQSPFGDERPVHHGPTLFQEVRPCRFVSTLPDDKYPDPWGGGAFKANESRTYYPIGVLVRDEFVNPCSEVVDSRSIAVALRIMAYDPDGSGAVFLAPSTFTSYTQPAVEFKDSRDAMREADVALHAQAFRAQPSQDTHLVIDIIGYFIPDPNGYGAQGPKGEKGDRGEAGAQGAQGEKGDRGEAGAQGAQGAKGDRGEAGARGEKGDKGEKGDDGEAGARGEKGDKGDKGDRGETGAQGQKGDKGDVGPMGPQGPQGPQGPAGPSGGGVSMVTGVSEFPPPGRITISHPSITTRSVILLIYINVSNGNALGTESQTNGSFVATGSPNKAFRWVAFNMN